jgi:diacylglycerol kinase family enzyme
MHIAPMAKMDDEQITLCLISAMGRLKTLALFPVMIVGWHTGFKAVNFVDCQHVTIIPEGPQTLCLDGNLYDCSGPLEFNILPQAVQIFC